MIYFLIFVYMLLLPITLLAMLWKILDKLDKEAQQPEPAKVQRKTHPAVGKVSYASPLAGRRTTSAYDKYKNKDGLYEPVMPKNGIEIKKKED